MSSPAIFRYFNSHDSLLTALSLDAYQELNQYLSATSDTVETGRPVTRLVAVCVAYRSWAVTNPAKFTLAYNSPTAGSQPDWEVLQGEAQRTLDIFIHLIMQILSSRHRGPQFDSVFLADEVREQIETIIRQRNYKILPEVLYTALAGWTRLFGLITLEINQQIQPLLADPSAFYNNEINQLLRLLDCDSNAD
jgi:AcrR family transcriptional regulator